MRRSLRSFAHARKCALPRGGAELVEFDALDMLARTLPLGLLLVARYRRSAPPVAETPRWQRRFMLYTALNGLAWGSAAWLLLPASRQLELVVSVVLAVLAASIMGDLAATPRLFLTLVLPMLAPLAASFMRLGGAINIGFGAGTLALTLALLLDVLQGQALNAVQQQIAARIEQAYRRLVGVNHPAAEHEDAVRLTQRQQLRAGLPAPGRQRRARRAHPERALICSCRQYGRLPLPDHGERAGVRGEGAKCTIPGPREERA